MAQRESVFLGLGRLTLILAFVAVVLIFVPLEGPVGEIAFGIAALISATNDLGR